MCVKYVNTNLHSVVCSLWFDTFGHFLSLDFITRPRGMINLISSPVCLKTLHSCGWQYYMQAQTWSCLITTSWSVSAKTRLHESKCCRPALCLNDRLKCTADLIPHAADWISKRAWYAVLIKCLGEGALTMHDYLHFAENK